MKEYGFTPSPHGRALRGHKTGAIGICFRALDTPVTLQKLAQFQRLVGERGYRPLFELTELDQRMGTDVINHFISMRVEGVLLVDTPPGEACATWLGMLKAAGIPAAIFEPLGPFSQNAVHLDREAGMAEVTRKLLELGHKRFGLLGIGREFPLGRPRYEGVAAALAEHKLTIERCAVVLNFPHERPAGLRYGQQLAQALLTLKKPLPTALLAVNDEVAAGAMWTLQRAGFSLPRDFSLFGFDNLAIATQTTPTLSSVDHQVEASARAAVDMVLALVEAGAAKTIPVVKIQPQVVVRESIGPARSSGASGRA
jgi:DNA-binding LacI/PurR family transcriptional regulator